MTHKKPVMAPPLQSILEAELARGNEVVEVADWPPKCQLLVILKIPFQKSYLPLPEVEYADINDSHYWKAEYNFKGGLQCLACRFG